MNLDSFLNLILKRKLAIMIIVILFVLLAAGFTFTQPFKYETSFKMLVIHNFGANTDPYVASKSNEYLSGILAKVIYSNSFFEKVDKAGFKINKDYFGQDTEKRMKEWKKTVAAKTISDTGIISVAVYHPDKLQADQIARAIAFSMQASHRLYHGYGDNVNVKIIDEPLTSRKPVKPNVILNFIGAVILGFFLSLIYIYLFSADEEYKFSAGNGSGTAERGEEENNWESVGSILEKKEYARFLSPNFYEDEGRNLEEDKLETLEDENNFGQSNLGN
ncbi:MAG: Wzz/FepE/Etk N-terminal domain-containing protein [Patescibacteria group bacterium]|nr:Wzz/FepE/Etk N-terminal domain-containing protein [Patescibacteria group bacterium]